MKSRGVRDNGCRGVLSTRVAEPAYRACAHCQSAIPWDHPTWIVCSVLCALRLAQVEDLSLELQHNPAFSFSNQVG